MEFNELKNLLLKRPQDISEKLYNYGYQCGQKSYINFEIIRQAFYNYNYSVKEELFYMQKIIRGYKDGEE